MNEQPYNAADWEAEFLNGRWDYLDKLPIERSRHAIISTYYQHYFPSGNVLDVGCGEATMCDYVNDKAKYFGIDISPTAIKKGLKKGSLNLICSDATNFEPSQKFDVIVFSEMLFYTDYKSLIKQYSNYLAKDGIFIISMFESAYFNKAKIVWNYIHESHVTLDLIRLKGKVHTLDIIWDIEVLRKK